MRRERDAQFEGFLGAEQQRLVGAVALLTGNREVAVDAVAEAVARAWERVSKGEEIDNLGGWIRVVAFNVARGNFRRRRNERLAIERLNAAVETPGPEAATPAADMQALLATLPRRQREVIVMHYFLDIPVDEIATELDLSEKTVRNFLRRARASLLGILENQRAPETEAKGVRDGVR